LSLNIVNLVFYLFRYKKHVMTLGNSKLNPSSMLLGVLVLLSVVVILPHAFAQVTYTDSDNPHGPLQIYGWTVGMAVAGALTGVGVWTTIKRR
jgi:hypothetical protein